MNTQGFLARHGTPATAGVLLGLLAVFASRLPSPHGYLVLLASTIPFLMLVAGSVKLVLFAMLLFEIPLAVDIYLDYRLSANEMNAVPGFNVSVVTGCLVIFALRAAAKGLVERREGPRTRLRDAAPYLAYLAVVLLSGVTAHDSVLWSYEVVLLAQAFLLFLAIAGGVDSRRDVLLVVVVVLGSLSLQALLMAGTVALGREIVLGPVAATLTGMRAAGTFGSPNPAAGFLVLTLFLAFATALASVPRLIRALAVCASLLGVIALLLTQSRGGWAGFLLALVVFTWATARRGLIGARGIVVIASLVLAPVLLFAGTISERVTANDGGAATSRLPLNAIAFDMARDHPVLGVGANNYAAVLPRYLTPEFADAWLSTVHNKYLLVTAETGVVGLAAFLFFLFSAARNGWLVWAGGDRLLAPLGLGLMAGLVGLALHMNVDIFNNRQHVQLLAVVAGLLLALRKLSLAGAAAAARAGGPAGGSGPERRDGRAGGAPATRWGAAWEDLRRGLPRGDPLRGPARGDPP